MTEEAKPKRRPPLRGGALRALLRDLALDDVSHEQLGRKYDRSYESIRNISVSHREGIEQMRQEINGQITGLWVAIKENRVAEYQQHIDDLNELLADEDLDPAVRARFIDKILKALHHVAEEMNELPTRVKFEPPPTGFGYEIIGEDGEPMDFPRVFGGRSS